MPYIKKSHRESWKDSLDPLLQEIMNRHVHPGELNYLITMLIHTYVHSTGTTYKTLNDVKGVLACASDEFTRRVINPYEDDKIKENGDV